jgi:hypothetical protein
MFLSPWLYLWSCCVCLWSYSVSVRIQRFALYLLMDDATVKQCLHDFDNTPTSTCSQERVLSRAYPEQARELLQQVAGMRADTGRVSSQLARLSREARQTFNDCDYDQYSRECLQLVAQELREWCEEYTTELQAARLRRGSTGE